MRAAPPPRHAPPRRSGGPLKFIFYTLMLLVLLAGGGVAFLLYAMPTDFIRDQMVAQVKAKTGRDLKIAGPTSFTIYPSIGLSMKDVSLSAPPGMASKPLVTMASLDASVRLMPLLKREIELERLILRQPMFNLEVDKQGKKSWDFAGLEAAALVRLAQAGAPASDAPGGLPSDVPPQSAAPAAAAPQMSPERLKGLEQIRLGDVRIENGALRYADARSGSSQEAKAINMRLGMTAISQPLDAEGDLVWKGQKIDFDSKVTSVKLILEDRPAKVALNLKSAPLAATFDGSVSMKDALDAEGALTATSPSARALAKWLGSAVPASRGFGPLEIKGQIRATGKSVTFSNADVGLDGAKATGQVSVETAGERPYVKANLKLSVLDLNTYLGGGAAAAAEPAPAKAQPAKAAGGADGAGKSGATSIDDLLEADKPGPKVKGYAKRAGWSNEAIDLDGLGAIDADAKLVVGKLLYDEIKIGQSQLQVALKNRVLKTTFDEIQLYKGKGRGFLTVDGTQPKTASIGANLMVEGVEALPFLKDAADLDWLSGTGKVTLAVAGQGASQKKIIETLNGKSEVVFANGAIVGINVPGMVRSISQGKLGGLKSSPSEKTDFSEMSATFNIANGIAQNQDLKLVSPLLRVTGAGNVSLPARQVDYTIKPKLVADLQGQGGNDKLAGLEIPVRVKGPWEKLDYTPELGGILKDPNKALDAVKEIGKQFKGKDAGEIVKGLLGGNKGGNTGTAGGATAGGTGAGAAQPQPQEKPSTKKLLDQFLKPQQ